MCKTGFKIKPSLPTQLRFKLCTIDSIVSVMLEPIGYMSYESIFKILNFSIVKSAYIAFFFIKINTYRINIFILLLVFFMISFFHYLRYTILRSYFKLNNIDIMFHRDAHINTPLIGTIFRNKWHI